MSGGTKFLYGTKYKGQTFQQILSVVTPEYMKSLRQVLCDNSGHKHADHIRAFLAYFTLNSTRQTLPIQVPGTQPPSLVSSASSQVHLIKHTDGDFIEIIYHISDIHIRNATRIQEYDTVITRTQDFLSNEEAVKNKRAVLIITGDILHTHELTSDCILRTLKYFKQFAAICPTLFIAGNHDTVVRNQTTTDALTAIFQDRFPSDVHYLRDTGYYRYQNLLFGVFSRTDSDKLPALSVPGTIKVGLYHGPVEGVVRSNGDPEFERNCVRLSTFKDFSMILLGDYHKYQHPCDKQNVAYAGSLIMQNFGEIGYPHGVAVWDVRLQRVVRHVKINNEYEHVVLRYQEDTATLHIEGIGTALTYDNEDELLALIPKKGHVRIEYSGLAPPEPIKRLLLEHSPSTRISMRRVLEGKQSLNSSVVDLLNPEQYKDASRAEIERFITEQLEAKKVSAAQMKNVMRDVATNIRLDSVHCENSATIHWRLERLEMENFLTYGFCNNTLDLTVFDNQTTTALVAPNNSGKSSIIDALTATLYGKVLRGTLSTCVNNKHTKNKSKLVAHIRIGIDIYRIVRIISRDGRKHQLSITKNNENFNGSTLSETQEKLTELIGSFHAFKTMSLCPQHSFTPLWLVDPHRRRELLQTFQPTKFQALNEASKKRRDELGGQVKELESLVQSLSRQPCNDQIKQAEQHLESIDIVLKKTEEAISISRKQLKNIDSSIPVGIEEAPHKLYLAKEELQVLDSKLSNIVEQRQRLLLMEERLDKNRLLEPDEERIRREHQEIERTIDDRASAEADKNPEVVSHVREIQVMKDNQSIALQNITVIRQKKYENVGSFKLSPDELRKCQEALQYHTDGHPDCVELEKKCSVLQSQLEAIEDQERELQGLQYNPDCEYCVNNPLVKKVGHITKEREKLCLVLEQTNRLRKLARADESIKKHCNACLDEEEVGCLQDVNNLREMLREKERELSTIRNSYTDRAKREIRRSDRYEDMLEEKRNNQVLKDQILTIKDSCTQESALLLRKSDIEKRINELQSLVEEAEKRKSDIQRRGQLLVEISEGESATGRLREERGATESRLKRFRELKVEVGEKEARLLSLKCEYEVYSELYRLTADQGPLCMHMLGHHFLPRLQSTVNQLAEGLIEKQVVLGLENKNNCLNVTIDFQDKNGKDTSHLGGMESFIMDICFRFALGQLSFSPRSNVFIVDEGMSVLDKDHLASLDVFLNFLSQVYDHTILISHIEGIGNYTDNHMTVVQDNEGYSTLVVN